MRALPVLILLMACRPKPPDGFGLDSALDLPCMARDLSVPVDAEMIGALGFAPDELARALGDRFAPELRRAPSDEDSGRSDDIRHFTGNARLEDIRIDADSWVEVTRSEELAPEGYRFGSPEGGPRPGYDCWTGTLVRAELSATAIVGHLDGSLEWPVAGWIESPTSDPSDAVFVLEGLAEAWRQVPRDWKHAIDKEDHELMKHHQLSVVVEGQHGWGGWFSVWVMRRNGVNGSRSPLVDLRWFDAEYQLPDL